MSYIDNQAKGIAILLWSIDLDNLDNSSAPAASPFLHAAVSGAMDILTEIYFTADSVYLLTKSFWGKDIKKDNYSFNSDLLNAMNNARDMGVKFYVCPQALDARGILESDLYNSAGFGGMTKFMSRAINTEWKTLVF